ncbi:GIY-YIG nuclease family protein [Sphingomonas ginsenosidivorax]|uniref:GIY-YIG nuclease family protein n=1 Tax=Sphingomonas ginsenosidivorax TaxID=862135 RepID=A0A5C6U9U5_9SPHN|nr:GIY-YIG nuclease family protein [Sphingomonas ginsenosidivorax]TXC69604.1 GIY-YIG nuclease family protein [Sphingomonas ginsenosidivorax]
MSAGIVYILTNEAMPGYVKIGLTRNEDVGDRVRQLDNTSIPVPFECYYAATVPDCAKLERTLHFVFGEKRARRNREFFTIDPDLAKAIIELVAGSRVDVSDTEQSIDPAERREIEQLRRRREVRTFTSLNVPIGATLTFTKDPEIACTVVQPRKVLFRGETASPTAAARLALHDMGYDWATFNGMAYWEYEGVKLSQMGLVSEAELEDEGE